MTILLDSTTATSGTSTKGNVKSFLNNLRAFIADFLGTDSANKGAALNALGALLNGTQSKSTSYTAVATDRGDVIAFSGVGGVTLSLASAAALGDGFSLGVINGSAAAVVIDPNLSETINGATNYVMQPGETVIVYCDGTKFILFGKFPPSLVSSINGSSGPISAAQIASAAATHWGYTPPSPSVCAPMTAIVGISGFTPASANGGAYVVATRANGSTFIIYVSDAITGGGG